MGAQAIGVVAVPCINVQNHSLYTLVNGVITHQEQQISKSDIPQNEFA